MFLYICNYISIENPESSGGSSFGHGARHMDNGHQVTTTAYLENMLRWAENKNPICIQSLFIMTKYIKFYMLLPKIYKRKNRNIYISFFCSKVKKCITYKSTRYICVMHSTFWELNAWITSYLNGKNF